jgi:hypothetical protein
MKTIKAVVTRNTTALLGTHLYPAGFRTRKTGMAKLIAPIENPKKNNYMGTNKSLYTQCHWLRPFCRFWGLNLQWLPGICANNTGTGKSPSQWHCTYKSEMEYRNMRSQSKYTYPSKTIPFFRLCCCPAATT